MCKISSLFEIVNMGILACEIWPNLTFLDPGPTLSPTYLIIVGQIQMKPFSTQTYLGKVLLQSIAAPLDFPLWSYSPLKMWKKYWSGQFDNFSTPPLAQFSEFSLKRFFVVNTSRKWVPTQDFRCLLLKLAE